MSFFCSPSFSFHFLIRVQTDRTISDCIRICIRKFDTDIWYPNIRADMDTDIVLNFNYPYPNIRYISYSLKYIMKIFMYIFTDIRSVSTCIRLISDPYHNSKIKADTDMILNFDYPYLNSRYIPCNLIYIMKIFMYIFTDIRSVFVFEK